MRPALFTREHGPACQTIQGVESGIGDSETQIQNDIPLMKIAIMQPYLFAYLGYYQLIANCDKFVIYDDVQYIKGGWINRNRILVSGNPHFITLPVTKESLNSEINQRHFTPDFEEQKARMARQ